MANTTQEEIDIDRRDMLTQARVRAGRPMVDNDVELSIEIIKAIELWMAIQVRELVGKGNEHDDGAKGYSFEDYLRVLNRRCPGVLRAMLDAGADIYV